MALSAIERLSAADIAAVVQLLLDGGLPAEDCNHLDNRFYGLRDDNELVACGGLQVAGNNVLLRSIVVSPEFQQQGLGRQLVEYLLNYADVAGFSAVYLLTETSAEYFTQFGFRSILRSSVPAGISKTAQFAALCPDSAVCMTRTLRR